MSWNNAHRASLALSAMTPPQLYGFTVPHRRPVYAGHMLALNHSFADALPTMAVEALGADFPDPQIVVLNEPLARDLGLDPTWLRSDDGLRWLTGANGGHATAYACLLYTSPSPRDRG